MKALRGKTNLMDREWLSFLKLLVTDAGRKRKKKMEKKKREKKQREKRNRENDRVRRTQNKKNKSSTNSMTTQEGKVGLRQQHGWDSRQLLVKKTTSFPIPPLSILMSNIQVWLEQVFVSKICRPFFVHPLAQAKQRRTCEMFANSVRLLLKSH